MGLNPRGRGRGRGGKNAFPGKGRRGGGMGGQGPMFRGGPPGMFCPPPMRFPLDQPPCGPFPMGPPGFNFGPPRLGFGKFPRKNFKRKIPQKNNDAPVPEIDLTKPWVTEEIKSEEAKKQEYLEIWRKSKDDGDWSNYKAQKQVVQTLYDKAKEEYAASHPNEAALWQSVTTVRKYYCDTCDKSFSVDDDLFLHEAEHETCGMEGCQFTAHPKVIAKHIRMQHDSGLYSRIGKLYTKEDIDKWIEERKKRYPTRKVMEEKKALELAKMNRGEKIKVKNDRFNKEFQTKSTKRKKTDKTNQKNRRKKKRKQCEFSFLEEEKSNARDVPAFQGIKSACEPENTENEDDLDISDEEWVATKTESLTKPLLNNSLGLLAMYNSDEEICDEEPQPESNTGKVSDDDGSAPEEVKTVRSTNLSHEEELEEKKVPRRRKLKKRQALEQERRKRNSRVQFSSQQTGLTLLEKLLRKEIIHERNVILQCVHYVVKNNFFQNT